MKLLVLWLAPLYVLLAIGALFGPDVAGIAILSIPLLAGAFVWHKVVGFDGRNWRK